MTTFGIVGGIILILLGILCMIADLNCTPAGIMFILFGLIVLLVVASDKHYSSLPKKQVVHDTVAIKDTVYVVIRQ